MRSRAAARMVAFSGIVGTRPSDKIRVRLRRALYLVATDGEGTGRVLEPATGESEQAVVSPKPGGGGGGGTIAEDPKAGEGGVPGERE